MAYTTINKSTDYFDTKIYTGNGSSQTLDMDNLGMLWMKNRTEQSNHNLFDSVRGGYYTSAPGPNLRPNSSTEGHGSDITSAYGITFGSSSSTIGSDGGGYNYNQNSKSYVGWQWRANGAGSSNTDGSRTTTVSVNTTAGFSIGTCSSLATNNDTLGHGLGAVPKMILVKNTQASGNWFVYHASLGNTKRLYLNATDASTTSTIWNDTTPTSSIFTIKGGDFATGESLVFYAFAEKTGYSKFGSYTGNGNVNGTFVYTGFKPAWVMIKRTDDVHNWRMHDAVRNPSNVIGKYLEADTSDAEGDSVNLDFISNGFKLRTTTGAHNASGGSYIYMAFGQSIVGSNNIPATAR